VTGITEPAGVNVKFALNVATCVGEKTTVAVVDWPVASVAGKVGDVIEKLLLVTATLLIVRDALPVFVTVVVSDLDFPLATLPN